MNLGDIGQFNRIVIKVGLTIFHNMKEGFMQLVSYKYPIGVNGKIRF